MSRESVFLIGTMTNQISGSKLPSKRDCLRVLFYNMRVIKLSLHESAILTIDECLVFWKKARIPTQSVVNIIPKLKKLYENWKNLDKNKLRKSATQKNNENEFERTLNNLFDIAHANAMCMIKIKEDREFLYLQRQEGRIGYMAGVDKKLTEIEERRKQRENRMKERVEQSSTSNLGNCCI